jgi:hypothetical protein
MPEIKVGDIVEIVNDNEWWNGTRCVVVDIKPSPDIYGNVFPYELKALTDTPKGHRKAGDTVGRWSEGKVRRINTAVDDAVASFSRPVDVFYSPTTGCAVVMAPNGKLIRILADGTIDE